jgi:hypothetical protein
VTDVFISYASEDRDRAAELAGALGALGWSVWWDRKIIAGQAFDHAIERELETAKSVVTLWSRNSVDSEWVKNEAAVAAERGVLVPALIESVKLPLEFRRKQTADLVDWKGEPSHGGFQALCEGVRSTLGGVPLPAPAPSRGKKRGWSAPWALAGMATCAVAVGFGVYYGGPWPRDGDSQSPTPPGDRPKVSTHSEEEKPPGAVQGLADLVAGKYSGEVIADSKGSSRSNIDVTITKLDGSKVRVTSNYDRLGTIEITLTREGERILQVDGDTPFIVELDKKPPTLTFNPHNELAYTGTKQQL